MIRKYKKPLFLVAILALISGIMLLPQDVFAQSFTLDFGQENGNGSVTGRIIQMVALLTILSLAPSILIMMTSFTRIIVVLSFLRTAMGIQQTPPNTVLISLALFLTLFIMTPTLQAAYQQGIQPLVNEEVDEITAFENAGQPGRAGR